MSDKSNNPVINYFQESFEELKKVTWPTRNQAIRMTFIVIGFCVATAFIIGVLDNGFNFGYRSLVLYAGKVAPPKVETPVKVDSVQTTADTQQAAKSAGSTAEPAKKSSGSKK